MSKETHQYKNDEITVFWKPELCIHSKTCWQQLPEVFKPKERPWVQMEGSTADKIIAQVKNCPSGALSYHLNTAMTEQATQQQSNDAITEKLKIQITPNGPYLIKSECVIIHPNGEEEIKQAVVALCRCGASANKPYCDGTHSKTGFIGQ